MKRRRSSGPGSKQARVFIRAIRDAGGVITVTARGHLRVVGPLGVALVGQHLDDARALRNAVGDIRRYAGLAIEL